MPSPAPCLPFLRYRACCKLPLFFLEVVFGLLEVVEGDQTYGGLLETVVDCLGDTDESIDSVILLRFLAYEPAGATQICRPCRIPTRRIASF